MIQLNAAPESVPVMDPKSVTEILQEPVSATRLNTFHGCRLRFYFRYVQGIVKPTNLNLFTGRMVHLLLQNWSRQRWHQKPATLSDLREEFENCWQQSLHEEPVEFRESDEDAEKQKVLALVEMYLNETPIPLGEKPMAVEVSVEADLSQHGLPTLRGVIDLIRPGGHIVDFKTTSTSPQTDMVLHRNELQLSCYGVLYRESTGTREKGFELHHLVKTKTPKLVVTRHRAMSEQQQTRLFRSMESYVHGVEAEDWVPSPGLQCSGCEFFHECRGGGQ